MVTLVDGEEGLVLPLATGAERIQAIALHVHSLRKGEKQSEKKKIDMARYVTFLFLFFFAGLVILVIW